MGHVFVFKRKTLKERVAFGLYIHEEPIDRFRRPGKFYRRPLAAGHKHERPSAQSATHLARFLAHDFIAVKSI
jgi:hypothetical protein